MKRLLLLSGLISCILFTGCNNNEEYKDKMETALDKIELICMLSSMKIYEIEYVWQTAIYDHEYNGRRCDNFEEALFDHNSKLRETDEYKSLMQDVEYLYQMVEDLNKYPKKYKEAYNELIELTTLVKEFVRMMEVPSGSLLTYSNKHEELYSDIERRIDIMRLKYIGVK